MPGTVGRIRCACAVIAAYGNYLFPAWRLVLYISLKSVIAKPERSWLKPIPTGVSLKSVPAPHLLFLYLPNTNGKTTTGWRAVHNGIGSMRQFQCTKCI